MNWNWFPSRPSRPFAFFAFFAFFAVSIELLFQPQNKTYMPIVNLDGIATRYEIRGEGPPLLMFSPGGFDATIEKWSAIGVYAKTKLMDALAAKYRCIAFDRRECGQSGGRIERVTWQHYVAQGRGLLDHLGIAKAHLLGGCMGCAPVAGFAAAHPEATLSMVLVWPVGGAKYRVNGQLRFARHLAHVEQHGLAEVVALAQVSGKSFGEDPRGGPWAALIRSDATFAAAFAKQDVERYKLVVAGMARAARSRHRTRRRARRFAAPGDPGAGHPRPRCLARHFGRALSGRVPAARRVLGRAGGRADRGDAADAGAGVSGPSFMIIDIHCHYPRLDALLKQRQDSTKATTA